MPEIQFNPAPGMYRVGTERQSAGRWYSGQLVRFNKTALQPVGGWVKQLGSNPSFPFPISGAPRNIFLWRDNTGLPYCFVGTHTHLYRIEIQPDGVNAGYNSMVAPLDMTPSSFGTSFNYQATAGFVAGVYEEAAVWSFDSFGQDLVGLCSPYGVPYYWNPSTPSTAAQAIPGAPKASSLLTTAQGILMLFGADVSSAQSSRNVAWSDIEDFTDWTSTPENSAGSLMLQTQGQILQGVNIPGGDVLILTDVDIWIASFVGGTLIYGFAKSADGCGGISRRCMINTPTQTVWMGEDRFWTYNGYVQELPCDVIDRVFGNINVLQKSKITCWRNSAFTEVWWHYPSAASTECDSYVCWNYADNVWTFGTLSRNCGADASVTAFPFLVGSDGYGYAHENGFSYTGATAPFAETGPFELGDLTEAYTEQGAKVWQATRFIPDDLILGDVSATFKSKIWPDGPELVSGPYTLGPKTDVRFTGRQVKMRVNGVNADSWRFGAARLQVSGQGDR